MTATYYNEHGHPIPDGMTPQEWRAYLDAQVEKIDAQADEDDKRRDNSAPVPLPLPDWMKGETVPLRNPDAPMIGGFPAPVELPPSATLRGLHKPTPSQRFMRIVRPFWRARLKRNIRAWLPAAVKDPRSVEAEFVSNWSFELRFIFGE